MRKDKLLLKEHINRLIEISGGNPVSNKELIVVDIQPEYEPYCRNILTPFILFLNKNHENLSRLVFLFNGQDTLGMININDYKMWWIENGLDEDIVDRAIFYDKGYAFFRYCMDSNIPHETIVNLVKFMIRHNINDSREINAKFWKQFVKEYKDDDYGTGEVRDLLEAASDCISIPDLMEFLGRYNNIVICGGGINECLKEVEIALDALGKQYNVLTQFTY